MNIAKLSTLHTGDVAVIAALHAEHDLYHRLAAMGFRIGKQIQIIRRARLGGPLHVRIGTTDIMLRRTDASKIDVHAAS